MKVKHIIALHAVICTLLVGGCLTADEDLTRGIIAWQRAYPDRKGDCMIVAMKRCAYYKSNGIPVKLCRGTFKGEGHAWTEYYDNVLKMWLVDDPSIWYISRGYPREAYKSGGKEDYVLKSAILQN